MIIIKYLEIMLKYDYTHPLQSFFQAVGECFASTFSVSMLLFAACFGVPIVEFIESYIYNDWGFLQALVIMILLDTLTGFVKYWKLSQISSAGFGKLLFKILTYTSVLIITHALTDFKIRGETNQFFGWFDDLAYSAVMIREAISILENLGATKNKFIPKSILKKLLEFDKDGDYVKKEDGFQT